MATAEARVPGADGPGDGRAEKPTNDGAGGPANERSVERGAGPTSERGDEATDETLAERGEFGLIAGFTERLPQGRETELGPGDDAAVIAAPDGRVVVTTDVLVENVHFRRDWSSASDIGRKAAAQNLADLAAMGARPQALVVGFAAPGDLRTSWALEFADGLGAECRRAGASVAGGDVVAAPLITVSITALGSLDGRRPVTRTGARPGDVVAVCGRLGWSAAGLALLDRRDAPDPGEERAGAARLPEAVRAAVEQAHRCPEPPYEAGPEAARLGATALIDVSDGLLADLAHLARAGGVRIDLDADALVPDAPVRAVAEHLGEDPLSYVLGGGEDHALAATFPNDVELPAHWRVVGRVLAPADPKHADPKHAGLKHPEGAASSITLEGAPTRYRSGHEHYR